MKVARIFLTPAGDRWYDMQLQDGQNGQTLFSSLRVEGAIVHPVFIVPAASVHSIAVFETGPQGETLQAPPGKLN